MTLPTVASLWVGRPLSWIEQLGLTSFTATGHKVVLYAYSPVQGVPEGVEVKDAAEIFEPSKDIRKNAGPALIADLFRLNLMKKTSDVWIDADMVAVKPLTVSESGFAIGFETEGRSVCNAVLRTPMDSAAIEMLIDFISNPHQEPPWLRRVVWKKISNAPEDQLLSQLFRAKRPALGPLALTYALQQTGEISEARPREAFYSVPWQYKDVLFNPYGGTDGWMSEETEAVHLWTSALSNYHKTRKPHPDSFVGKMQSKLGIKISHLK